MDRLEKKYEDLCYKIKQIKQEKENEIKNIVKQVIFDESTKSELLKELEKIIVKKYKLIDADNNKKGDENNFKNKWYL